MKRNLYFLFPLFSFLFPPLTAGAEIRERISLYQGWEFSRDSLFSEMEIRHPQTWDTESPRLYTAVAQLIREDGTVADEVSEQFGIRTIEIGPDFGLKLNGKNILPFNDWGVTCYKMMKPVVERYDSTRKVTVAMHPRYRNWETDSLPCDLAMITDVQAYNYRYMYFPGDGRRFPWMTFYQSEASISSMGPNWFEMNLDRVIGLAYWGAIDYLGESQGWPAKGWAQGVVDIALEPKPKAWLMKSVFSDEPTVHTAVVESRQAKAEWNGIETGNAGLSEDWNRTEGDTVSLVTYTNADEVELRLNGKSLGRQHNPQEAKRRDYTQDQFRHV